MVALIFGQDHLWFFSLLQEPHGETASRTGIVFFK